MKDKIKRVLQDPKGSLKRNPHARALQHKPQQVIRNKKKDWKPSANEGEDPS